MNKDGPVSLRVAGRVLLPRSLLDGRAVLAEHLDFLAVVSPVVQGLPADGAAHAAVSILSEEDDNLAGRNMACQPYLTRRVRRERESRGVQLCAQKPANQGIFRAELGSFPDLDCKYPPD